MSKRSKYPTQLKVYRELRQIRITRPTTQRPQELHRYRQEGTCHAQVYSANVPKNERRSTLKEPKDKQRKCQRASQGDPHKDQPRVFPTYQDKAVTKQPRRDGGATKVRSRTSRF